jgi:cyclopropane fatty-acyl-phospholipid synthase-like methyltransferase
LDNKLSALEFVKALHLKWLSKDMNEHDQYMADFMTVFQGLERWAPSSDADTLKALSILPATPTKILDIGCGKGFSTRLLAKHTQAQIVGVDNEQRALDELRRTLVAADLDSKVTLTCASMTELPFAPKTFDCIWSEGSAYIMGVEQALNEWQKLLADRGYMVVSDLIWLSDKPSQENAIFWDSEYPDMKGVEERLNQMHHAGFEVIDHFTLSEHAWHDYYRPLKTRVANMKASMPTSAAIGDIEREISMYERYLGEFGYHMFVLQKEG